MTENTDLGLQPGDIVELHGTPHRVVTTWPETRGRVGVLFADGLWFRLDPARFQ